MPNISKADFIKQMMLSKAYFIKQIGKLSNIVVRQDGNTMVRIEIDIRPGGGIKTDSIRENMAGQVANRFGGKINPRKKTEVLFSGFKAAIKQKLKHKEKLIGNFGLLADYAKEKGYILNSPSPTEPDEMRFIHDVNAYITKIGDPITIEINGKKFKNIVGANKVSGTPKADIVLVQKNGSGSTYTLKEVCYLSHKKEGGAASFQQYAGVTSAAGSFISEHKIVQKFLKDVAGHLHDKRRSYIAQSGFSASRDIKSDGKALVGKSLFGPNWSQGSTNYGKDNVNYIAQGRAQFIQKRDVHILFTKPDGFHNPVTNWAMGGSSGQFQAVLAATYRTGRGFDVKIENKQVRVGNLRAGIYPKAFVTGRKVDKTFK